MGFIIKLVDELLTKYNVDPDRVYLAGHSNGCALAQRVAYEHSNKIAGVACHSFYLLPNIFVQEPLIQPTLLANKPSSYTPVPIFEVHGGQDSVVGYDNGFIGLLPIHLS